MGVLDGAGQGKDRRERLQWRAPGRVAGWGSEDHMVGTEGTGCFLWRPARSWGMEAAEPVFRLCISF